jgi:hypothetical protein
MNLAKFVSLLDRHALYFCQVNDLDDPFEGSLWPSRLLDRSGDSPALRFAHKVRSYYPKVKVNCWHLADSESAAMWRLYSGANAGIAIQSTFSGLCEAFKPCACEVRIGKVRYINYDKEYFEKGHGDDIYTPFLYKRLSYQYESEVRAIITDGEGKCVGDARGGLYVPVDLGALVRKVRVAPDTPDWVTQLVVSISAKYGVDADITRSILGVDPLY